MRVFPVAAAVLTLAGPASAAPTPPLADICAALAVTEQDGEALSDADQQAARAILDDRTRVWRRLRVRQQGDRLVGRWGECPAPKIRIRFLAFSPDGRLARLESKNQHNVGSDGDIVLARKTEDGWRLMGWWEWVVVTT